MAALPCPSDAGAIPTTNEIRDAVIQSRIRSLIGRSGASAARKKHVIGTVGGGTKDTRVPKAQQSGSEDAETDQDGGIFFIHVGDDPTLFGRGMLSLAVGL